MNTKELRTAIKNIIIDLFPFLGTKAHMFYKAKVLAVNSTAGTPNLDGTGNRFYSLDIQFLTLSGEIDKTKEILKDVPIDIPSIGDKKGIYGLPSKDSIVRVGFYEGNLAYPYIDGVLTDGKSLNALPDGDITLFRDENTKVSLKNNGDIEIKAQKVSIDSNNIILANGSDGVARLNDTVDVQLAVGYGGFGAVTSVSVISAKINSASSKIKAG